MRVYAAAGREELQRFAAEGILHVNASRADSDDEADEFDAMQRAAATGPVVIVADVDVPRGDVPSGDVADTAIALNDVAAWHVDADGSGHLAWFARQELDQVIAVLTGG